MLITPEDFAESIYLFDFLPEKGKVVLYCVVFEQAFLVAISLYMVSLTIIGLVDGEIPISHIYSFVGINLWSWKMQLL